MMRKLFKKFNRANSGFTFIELAVSMAIGSVLIAGLAGSIHQIVFFPPKVRANSVVMQQAQNLSYWISHDGQMVQTIHIGDDPNTGESEAFSFHWVGVKRTDVDQNEYIDTFWVRYLYNNNTLSRCEQLHTDKYNSGGNLISSTDNQNTTIIAEHVSSIEGSSNADGFTVSATFSYDDTQVQRTYDMTPRVNIFIQD
jgi:prepilin-type N-terminal cleavage/methylation domain-containing protein